MQCRNNLQPSRPLKVEGGWAACCCVLGPACTQQLPRLVFTTQLIPPIHWLAGGQILQYAEDFDARALVLMHHGRHSMVRELQYGAITTHCAKFSTRPLVMLEEQYVKPKTASS